MGLSYAEFNHMLILITLVAFSLALLLLIYAYCRIRCGCCTRRRRSVHKDNIVTEAGKLQETQEVNQDTSDFDFIDERHNNVISSTVRVTSLRNIEEVPKA